MSSLATKLHPGKPGARLDGVAPAVCSPRPRGEGDSTPSPPGVKPRLRRAGDGIPCSFLTIRQPVGDQEVSQPSGLQKPAPRAGQVRFCIAFELERLAKHGRLVLVTFTFPDAPSLSEAKHRVGELLRRDFGDTWAGLTVAEQHQSGRWHIHAAGIVVGREWDGHWSRTRRGWRYYGGVRDLAFWSRLRAACARHRIGRVQCVPCRDGTHQAAARYVAKYVSKSGAGAGGRRVEFQLRRKWHYAKRLQRRSSLRFMFLNLRSWTWRMGCSVVYSLRLTIPAVFAIVQRYRDVGTGLGWVWPLRGLIAGAARGRIAPACPLSS